MTDHTRLGQAFYNFTMRCGRFLIRHRIVAQLLTVTWGLLGVAIGLIEMLIVLLLPKKKRFGVFNGFPYVMFGMNWGGLEGFLWFFVADGMGDAWTAHIKQHEVGHSFQNAIYGPFTPFIITIPSIIRYWARKGSRSKKSYDAIWFEGSATAIGEEYDSLCRQKKA